MRGLPLSKCFRNKKVFITGHTGFKGSWLTLWLKKMGADIHGYALPPPTTPSLFELLKLENDIHHTIADIRDKEQLTRCISQARPDIIFHLAAQSVVRESYITPVETIETNVLGTVNVMEAVRATRIATALVMVTSDKCYQNNEWLFGYRENDPLGGHDPYSASKSAAEIMISSWRNSFFDSQQIGVHGVRMASVRAGNVVGGGDWTKDQIIPDCIRSLSEGRTIQVRNPKATRPWQHVLEPLFGYLELGAKLLSGGQNVAQYCDAFNFGPLVSSNKVVRELVEEVIKCWGYGSWEFSNPEKIYHESSLLSLALDKSYHRLNWLPKWNFEKTISNTVAWYKIEQQDPSGIRNFTLKQIEAYESDQDFTQHSLTHEEINLDFANK
jgi:CDP-glucose 4,6-dehydratase